MHYMSHPLSVRLNEATIARLGRHAQRAHLAPRTLAQRYVEEGPRMDEHPLIRFADGPAGRRARLVGTGKDVWVIIAAVRDNGGVLVNVFYKHSRIKQYLKDGKAMRIETVVNAPRDLGCKARLPNLDELQARARAANRRLLDAERAGQGTVLASPAFERVAHPLCGAKTLRVAWPGAYALPS